jgi:hypothetical protein
MVSYLYNSPAGVPGDITRVDETSVEPAMLIAASGTFAQAYGIPVKYVAGGIQQFNGGAETAASFAGVLTRVAPAISGNVLSGFSDTIPNPVVPQSFVPRGYVSVLCAAGTPVRGDRVYVQIIANGGVTVGSFRATADGSNTIQLTNCTWASDGKDADNNAEIRVAQ